MFLIDEVEVVEVAAHGPGRVHGGVEVDLGPVREGRENVGQHGRLDPCGKVQLRADAFLLGGGGGELVHVLGHVSLHIGHGKAQVLDLVAGVDVQGGEVVRREVPGLAVLRIGSGRLGNGVDGIDDGLLHAPGIGPGDQSRQQDDGGGEADGKGFDAGNQIRHVDVHQEEGVGDALLVLEGQAGGAEPAVVLGVVDVIEAAVAVPVQELPHALLGDGLPFAGKKPFLLLGVHHVDHGAGLLVVHGDVDVVDVVGVQVARQHVDQDVVVVALLLGGEERTVFLRTRCGPLFLCQGPVLLHDLIRKAHGVGAPGGGALGDGGQLDRVVYILICHGDDIDGQTHQQGHRAQEHAAEDGGSEGFGGDGTVLPLQPAHGTNAFLGHGTTSFHESTVDSYSYYNIL